MIRFRCPGCRGAMQVADEHAGKAVRCGACAKVVRAPVPEADASKAVEPPLPTRVKRRPAPKWPWVLGAVAAVLVLFGVAIAVAVRSGAKPEPVAEAPKKTEGEAKKPPAETPKDVPKDKPPPKNVEPKTDAEKAVFVVNTQRRLAKVPELALDADGCAACLDHAEHLLNNAEADPHTPIRGRPGTAVASRVSVIRASTADAIRDALASPPMRALLLRPGLKRLALATIGEGDKAITVVDILGPDVETFEASEPVVYPTSGQVGVPLYFPGNEIPDPLPEAEDKLAGFPVTLQFPPGARVTAVKAAMADAAGKDVPAWVSSPESPANAKYPRHQTNTVCLIAKEPLRPGTRYVVAVEAEVGGKAWSRALSFATVSADEIGRGTYLRALARVNHFRKAAGVGEVTLSPESCRACTMHAAYLAQNADPNVLDASLNDEVEGKPGFTAEGKAVAKQAVVKLGGGVGPRDAVDWMLGGILNRHRLLNPTMKTIGLGATMRAPGGWIWVIDLPPTRRQGDGGRAVLFPGRGQKDVPTAFGREAGDTVPGLAADAQVGFAITANFFPLAKVSNASAVLSADGAEVPCHVSIPDKPLRNIGNNRQIILLPKEPLKPATTYAVRMSATADGTAWEESWEFTTMDVVGYEKQTAASMLAEVNEARKACGLAAVALDEKLSIGCRKHADYVVRNFDHPKVRGLGIHDEDASLPGASPEGKRAGEAGVIALIGDPADSVAGWMATLYHRLPLLDPRLRRIGYGQALHPLKGWITVMDVGTGR